VYLPQEHSTLGVYVSIFPIETKIFLSRGSTSQSQSQSHACQMCQSLAVKTSFSAIYFTRSSSTQAWLEMFRIGAGPALAASLQPQRRWPKRIRHIDYLRAQCSYICRYLYGVHSRIKGRDSIHTYNTTRHDAHTQVDTPTQSLLQAYSVYISSSK
jgi:hypothetical protein